MGVLDYLPCCGRRRRDEKDPGTDESAALLPAPREGSILSNDGTTGTAPGGGQGYGSIPEPPNGGMSGEQRKRIEAIGREVGNQMLPIHNLPSRQTSHSHLRTTPSHLRTTPSHLRTTPSRPDPTNSTLGGVGTHSSTSSAPSSRPSSPSPLRPTSSPPGGTLMSSNPEYSPNPDKSTPGGSQTCEESKDDAEGVDGDTPEGEDVGVVKKQLFGGMGGGGGDGTGGAGGERGTRNSGRGEGGARGKGQKRGRGRGQKRIR